MIRVFQSFSVIFILLDMFIKMLFYSFMGFRTSSDNKRAWVNSIVIKWAQKVLSTIKLTIQPINPQILDSVNWNRNIFVVANHQSYADIPTIIAGANRTFGFIAKNELKYIPFLQFWMSKIGCVFINRARYISSIKTLKKLEIQGHGSHLTIFPEGTRSKNGRLKPFKTGGLKIAWDIDAILVPTIIQGTRDAWENRQNSKIKKGTINFYQPIDLAKIKKNTDFKSFILQFKSDFQTLYTHANS